MKALIKNHSGEIFLALVAITIVATAVLTVIMVIGYENMNRI